MRPSTSIVASALVLLPTGARAESSDEAERLFREAKDAVRQERYRVACPLFEQSHRLDPAGGTVLALALCYERIGRLASASIRFTEALDWARRDNREDRQTIATQHRAQLATKLSHLTIRLSPGASAIDGLIVTHNAKPVSSAQIGQPIAVDGGEHILDVSAPGRVPLQLKATVRSQRHDVELVVPSLATVPDETEPKENPAAAAPQPVERPAPLASRSERPPISASSTRWLGYLSLGVGAVGVGAATTLALLASSNRDRAEELCPTSPCGNREGVDSNDAATTQATYANIAAGVGLVGLAFGTFWLLTRPSQSTQTATLPVSLSVSSRGGGAAWRMRF